MDIRNTINAHSSILEALKCIDEEGTSFVDNFYSKAYLRHLVISKEMLAAQIATLHNLSFYLWLVTEARKKIIEGIFMKWKDEMVVRLARRL